MNVETAVITFITRAMVLAIMALSRVLMNADLRTGIFHPLAILIIQIIQISYIFWDPSTLFSSIVSVRIITLVETAVITIMTHAMVLALMVMSHVVMNADVRKKGIPPDHFN